MKTFAQLLDDLVLATAEIEHERRSTLRDKHPEYLRAAQDAFELAYRTVLAYNKKFHSKPSGCHCPPRDGHDIIIG